MTYDQFKTVLYKFDEAVLDTSVVESMVKFVPPAEMVSHSWTKGKIKAYLYRIRF